MSGAAEPVRAYRRLLWCYPRTFRAEYGAEILDVLAAGARNDRRRLDLAQCGALLLGALRVRLRGHGRGMDRRVLAAVRLMYLGALVELATALVVQATMGDVRSAIVERSPGYTAAQWHAEVAGRLNPLVVGALVAVLLWLWLAWANGRMHSWARIAFVLFFALNTYSLLDGLVQGSAVYARAALAAGLALWLVHLAAVVLLIHPMLARSRPRCLPRTGIGAG